MHQRLWNIRPHVYLLITIFSTLTLLFLAACGGSSSNTSPTTSKGTPTLAAQQVLTMPNVGTAELGVLDPALGPDANSSVAVNMIYSGLVRTDQHLNVIPDQASWQISADQKTYTFTLKPGIKFSDGTPLTAQSYVYTLTRALLPEVKSGVATLFEGAILGANDVNSGKTKTLAGVQAVNATTLKITLAQPAGYFLEALANSIFFPLNEKIITQYGQTNWTNHVAGGGVGTGPFMVKEWDHNVKMVLVPNPYYYGAKPTLSTVTMLFVADPSTAFKSYRAGQYNFMWNITPDDQATAKGIAGFTRTSLLQTDLLFFDNTKAPFTSIAVRQAFSYAIDKATLARAIFKDAVTPAPTIIPPGMPGYQANYQGIPYDRARARELLQSVYPDLSKVPHVTFAYPSSQVSPVEAQALQGMWQSALGIQVSLNAVELSAYNDLTSKHQISFGFTQWTADFPDPYDWLTLNLLSTAPNNNGNWHSTHFDKLVGQAEQASGDARIALYNQAEQLAITEVGWLPVDHQTMAAIIPTWLHGVSLNQEGLYFGDWSDVSILQH